MKLEVLVRLLVPDPWSFTVLETLRRKSDYRQVVDVTHLRCWRIWFSLDDQRCIHLLEKMMSETSLLANPNRDRWLIWKNKGEMPKRFWQKTNLDSQAFVIRVTDVEDLVGRSMCEVVRKRLGLLDVSDIRFSNLWLIEITKGDLSPEEIAKRVAIAYRWKTGLLSNPNFQTAKVVALNEYLEKWYEIEP